MSVNKIELIHLLYLKIHTNISKFLIYTISIISQNCRYWNLNRKGVYTKNKYSYCTFDRVKRQHKWKYENRQLQMKYDYKSFKVDKSFKVRVLLSFVNFIKAQSKINITHLLSWVPRRASSLALMQIVQF